MGKRHQCFCNFWQKNVLKKRDQWLGRKEKNIVCDMDKWEENAMRPMIKNNWINCIFLKSYTF